MKSFVTQQFTALTNLIPIPLSMAKPRNPSWLDEINSECASALREIEGTLIFLAESKEIQQIKYFSKRIFQSKINLQAAIDHEKKLIEEKKYIESIFTNAQKIWDETKIEKMPDPIQRVNKHHQQLILDGQQIGVAYFETAKKLELESKETFEKIEQQAKSFLLNLDNVGASENGTLRIASEEYKKAKEHYKNLRDPKYQVKNNNNISTDNKFSLEEAKKINYRNAGAFKIETFKQLQKAYNLANDFSNNFPANKKAIIDSYEAAEKKYDVTYSKERYAFSNTAYEKMRGLTKAISDTKPLILDVHYVEGEKQRLVFDKVVDLIKNAVSNIDFWNRQVSCFGSSSKINRRSVPIGVSQIFHTIQSQNFDSDSRETLTRIIKATEIRDTMGNGLFAKRNTNTTGKFYNLIKEIDINNFTIRESIQLESKLKEITDNEGALISLFAPAPARQRSIN